MFSLQLGCYTVGCLLSVYRPQGTFQSLLTDHLRYHLGTGKESFEINSRIVLGMAEKYFDCNFDFLGIKFG